ncbi:glycosyl hydrolase 115 family protein [Coraliomargarita sp. SDUM461004]|uniref:Glycosyl hydrolase 115 family protein n=1 Tax=Thalassobacterium sedimentorum TaxID=3041258 RepID=A0ABU1APF8_9BACT|nr:glycosyl hydrolase 115 family protein [Coraliomargarita sp. SDUM461004]MDQ8195636.1 glycosyl hydrolase 115 family protein [Coraliomargarita sp. SDUM461004]
MKWIHFFMCVLVTTSLTAKSMDGLTINGDTPWVVTAADFENPAIQEAIRDAERDWYKVFGYPPVIFKNNTRSSWTGPVVIFGSVEHTSSLVDAQVPAGAEQHVLRLAQVKNNPGIAAIGGDTRGTIFAIYTFCEEVLGIDPMYVFTDSIPEKRTEVSFTSADEYISKKPTFENRGWFINDEELHDGMHRDPLGGNVISMEWMDKIIETLLRTKGNMLIPESSSYSDATVYDLCKRRDVIITFHHISPLGLNMMDWPKGLPFSYVTHKDILEDAWRKSAQALADKKVAWIVGFRGESDGAFWHSDPAAPKDDQGRADVIAAAMQKQTEIVREFDPDATIVAALWNELGRFYNDGILQIPDGVCKMFADDGRGYMRDKGDGSDLSPGDGLYYHVMMMMNTQNRTTEAVPPARIYNELRRYVERGATKYAIINVSGIRPAAMSVQAINDFLWDAEPYLSQPADKAMQAYLQQWYAKQFSPELAADLAALRLHYYDIPYLRENMPDPTRWRGARGEHLLQYLTQEVLKKYSNAIEKGEDIRNVSGFANQMKQTKGPLTETAEFFPALWRETKALESRIPVDRRNFYQAHFTYQVAVHMYGSRMLDQVVQGVDAYLVDQNPQVFANNLKLALAELEKILSEAHKAEYGIWDTMFMHVRLMDMWRTRLMLKETIARIEGSPYTSKYRGIMNGSFWGSAQDYMNNAEGVYPYFYKHTGRGLDVLENGSYPE